MSNPRWPAHEAAALVLKELRGPDGRLAYPIDPVRIARDLGINVYSAKLENSLSGLIAKTSEVEPPEVFLNSEHAPVRQRFTCAHELGHYFHNETDSGPGLKTYVHRRDARSSCGTDVEEIYANQFAANLLMPEDVVKDLYAMYGNPVPVAMELEVSLEALNLRMKKLRIGQ
ncbi:ImmA/IrrE family metallo-endopeptidase [Rhodococcus sp. KB6]|uniref:ImmA/IrrE family metallo-endopeptidase n=1 Tax=Rhodococcus sp. KB6 TaxID=1752066 RepID=UPI000718212C|nr:ImmA/IrrE family metallo-endopeptidase [Rhodococcus sp. KB6]